MALICTKIVYKVGCIYDTEDNKKSHHDGDFRNDINIDNYSTYFIRLFVIELNITQKRAWAHYTGYKR